MNRHRPDVSEFTEPGFHSVARAPHDSRPTINVEHDGPACIFTIEFGAGANTAERIVLTVEAVGNYRSGIVRRDELLFARAMIPTGHTVNIRVEWEHEP